MSSVSFSTKDAVLWWKLMNFCAKFLQPSAKLFMHESAVAWVPGETTVLADAASRNNFGFLEEWAAIQGMTLRRVDIPKFESFMRQIYNELSNNTSGLLTGPEYSSDDIGDGPDGTVPTVA